MKINTEAITPNIGAEITGADLANLNDESFGEIHAAFLKHQVLVFRDQKLSRDEHKEFGRRFGEIHIHPSKRNGLNTKDDPELFIIDTKPDAKLSNGEAWHSDVSCEIIPPLASLLYVTKIPENGRGDTMFANMCEAYNELSPAMKLFLSDKTAFHDGEIDLMNYGIRLKVGQTYPRASHPVITKHPETGQPILFVNKSFTSHIEQLNRWESDALLAGLYDFIATNLRTQCRVRWTPNTLVMWDNRSVQHQAIRDYSGYARYGERVSVVPPVRPVAFSDNCVTTKVARV